MTLFLITSNNSHDDIVNYSSHFNLNEGSAVREVIFAGLGFLALSNGLTFYTYRALFVFVAGGILFVALRKFKVNVSGFLLCYLPILMFMDSIQFRNAVSIWILAACILFLTDKKFIHGNICFVISILFISQIHTAFVFYLILLFYNVYKKNKKLDIIFCTLLGIIVVFTLLNGNSIPYFKDLLSVFLDDNDARLNRYSTTASLGFLYPTLLDILTISLLSKAKKKVVIKNELQNEFIRFSIFLCEISLFFVPFMMMNITYYRFIRNAYFISIMATICIIGLCHKKKYKIHIVAGMIVVTALWVVFEIVIYDTPEQIMGPILDEGIPFYKME